VDLSNLTATQAIRSIKAGVFSCLELLDAQAAVVEKHNPNVNAVVAEAIGSARLAAKNADHRWANGENLGSLHGFSLTIKDCFETVGLPTSAGSATLADHMTDVDADAVQAMRANGAIIYGKTNVPLFGGDHQTYNEVYGVTNNPWDTSRTAGGSSGGAAAAVATGMSLAEYGSDIGGSIRQPAHMNGVFGFKPSHGVLSLRGHIPGPPGTLAHPDLTVAGPLGRSVDDLELMMRTTLTVGAFGGIPGASLPAGEGPPKPEDLRIGLWPDEPMAKVAMACSDSVIRFGTELEAAGALVDHEARPSFDVGQLFSTYLALLWPVTGAGLPSAMWHELDRVARAAPPSDESSIAPKLMTASHKAWLRANEMRARIAAAWTELFAEYDAVIMPVAPTQAFPHNTEAKYLDRVVDVDGQARPYSDTLFWAGLATAPGLPSVTVPAGVVHGLPVGVQIVGPKYSDLGLLDIARTICEVTDARFIGPELPIPGQSPQVEP
jgi:amidase